LDEAEKQKIKDQKARVRRARNAQRKLKKARVELEALGEITDWEDEFIASVDERLEKYDSAFADPSLGGFGQALSNKQQQVLAQMRKKIKDKSKQTKHGDKDDDPAKPQWRSSFKNKSGFKPRVRNIEDDMYGDISDNGEPSYPESQSAKPPEKPPQGAPMKAKPFLKIIDGGKK